MIFDGFQLLDLSGPATVFGGAAQALGKPSGVIVVSPRGGQVRSSAGVSVATISIRSVRARENDMLLVVGGEEGALRALVADDAAAGWFCDNAARAARFGSICSGAFALAQWGLAQGRRVATHWAGAKAMAAAYPDVTVDAEAMYVQDGNMWTSAGVSTGIDMALAIVEHDLGAAIANSIARRLVLSVRRPGHQSQFSPMLDAQAKAGGDYAELIGYIAANLEKPLDVETLAAKAGEAPRSFHRHFTTATGKTPAAFVAAARLDQARALLSEGAPLKTAAAASGFTSAEHLTRRFSQAFGLPPGAWRSLNQPN